LQLHTSTQGASIAYRFNREPHWRLYTAPIRLQEGKTTITTKAIRIGYKESVERKGTFTVL
jgi:hypothetical protein